MNVASHLSPCAVVIRCISVYGISTCGAVEYMCGGLEYMWRGVVGCGSMVSSRSPWCDCGVVARALRASENARLRDMHSLSVCDCPVCVSTLRPLG